MGVDGVDEIFLEGVEFVCRDRALQNDDVCRANEGPLFPGEDLHALGGGVGALVELAGEEFDSEGSFVAGDGKLGACELNLGLGEDEPRGLFEFLVGEAIEIVSLHDAGGIDGIDGEICTEVSDEVSGLAGE